jgi:hypothetical protein
LVEAADTFKFSKDFANAIINAAESIDKALKNDPTAFKVDDLAASIRFTIESATGGGINAKFNIVPVSLQFTGKVTPSNTHEVVLTFENPKPFTVALDGAHEVPKVNTAGTGTAELTYFPDVRKIAWSLNTKDLSGPVERADFHGPAAEGATADAVISMLEDPSTIRYPITGEATLTPDQERDFLNGKWYINVTTVGNPKGETHGQVKPPKS